MSKLTDKQIKTRWVDVKKQIKERQLLAYRVGIPLDKWDEYMYSLPSHDEIDRIYLAIQEDRRKKTLRIKEGLSKIVGYRESNEYARKSGVSNNSIREIIEGKKEMAGYDIINRLELFLHVVLDNFELSLENPLTVKAYAQQHIGEIATSISRIADNLHRDCFTLTELARKMEKNTDWQGNTIEPSRNLEFQIKQLTEIKNQLDTFWEIYIDRKV